MLENEVLETKEQSDESFKTTFSDSLSKIINFLDVSLIHKLDKGDVAELRRIQVGELPSCPAFWKLITSPVFSLVLTEYEPALLEQEKQWAVVMASMALSAGLHDVKSRLGESLAKAEYSEMRLERLLRAQGEDLQKHILLTARFLNAKAQHFNCIEMAGLIFYEPNKELSDKLRHSIARGYYFNRFAQKKGEE